VDALRPGTGVWARLIATLAELATAAGARRVLVMVTNDNVRGLRYYQRLGFRLSELRAGAIEELRGRKPWIPARGEDDIPLRDELQLVRDL
jgi:ribosomal protein S18 acetylase RimI-like enzyme